jgi:RNA polymerase sigma-70 factor (ECF subfamily)
VTGPGPTDAELLGRCADGDREAFRPLMERHLPAVERFLRALGAEPDRVDDAVQETFVAAWRHASSFRGEEARPWLLRIARNALRRTARRRAGEPRTHLPLDELALEAGWGSDDEMARHLEARETVRRGFAGLEPSDREILVLRDLEGFTGSEAADLLGISLAAQKSRLHRARLRFMAAVRARIHSAPPTGRHP